MKAFYLYCHLTRNIKCHIDYARYFTIFRRSVRSSNIPTMSKFAAVAALAALVALPTGKAQLLNFPSCASSAVCIRQGLRSATGTDKIPSSAQPFPPLAAQGAQRRMSSASAPMAAPSSPPLAPFWRKSAPRVIFRVSLFELVGDASQETELMFFQSYCLTLKASARLPASL